MDIRLFYYKIREIEAKIADPEVVVVSLETPEGGVYGVKTEVKRGIGAKLIYQGKARLATPEETEAYHTEMATARRQIEDAQAVSKVQLTVLQDSDLKVLKSLKPLKP